MKANTGSFPKDDWWTNLTSKPMNFASWTLLHKTSDHRKRTLVKRVLYDLVFKKKEEYISNQKMDPVYSLPENQFRTPGNKHDNSKLPSLFTAKSAQSTEYSSCKSPEENPYRRVVKLLGFPVNTSPSSLVGLVRGGSLEKVAMIEGDRPLAMAQSSVVRGPIIPPRTVGTSPSILLHFLLPLEASSFLSFVNNSSLVEFRGKRLLAQWANQDQAKNLRDLELAPHISEEINRHSASRVVILSCYNHAKAPSDRALKLSYPHPRENFHTSFNCNALKVDFGQFGQIIDVTPVISPKLSVSIQFADIRSAILVMHTFNSRNSVLRSKYAIWSAKYARDVTNKPCFNV